MTSRKRSCSLPPRPTSSRDKFYSWMAALAYNPRALLHNLQMKALVLVPLAALFCGTGFAQSGPEQGATEIQVWTAGGHSAAGGPGNTGICDASPPFGWVSTKPALPHFLKAS